MDYHPSVQLIAFVNTDTGECGERRLSHSDGEAEKFYRELKAEGCSVRVGMEATEHARWFERLLAVEHSPGQPLVVFAPVTDEDPRHVELLRSA
jgi:tRNA splicing endonuclease